MIRQTALLLLAFALGTGAVFAETAPETPEVMVLGTFHFTGGGHDMINPQVDDFLSDRRQAEIAEVNERLAAFRPTKILVEWPADEEVELNTIYQNYLAGEHSLSVNERQQIGMRLAARFSHAQLYAVDHRRGMDFNAMMTAAQDAGQHGLIEAFTTFTDPISERMNALSTPENTVLDRMIYNNTQEIRDFHHLYLLLAQMGSLENPAGAEEMTGWWGRNLQIYANIARVAEPGDRILVIYGSGHKFLLDQFVADAPNLVWIDALDYLSE